jgi:branched-chain amino acid transport system permease protein
MADLIVPILVNGSITALVALAFHVVIRSTGGIADFALGQYVIIGGLTTALAARHGYPLGVVLVLGVVVPCIAALLNEILVMRRIIAVDPNPAALAPVVATVSILWIWEQLSRLAFGDFPIRGPATLPGLTFHIGDIAIPAHSLVIIAVTALFFLTMQLWLGRTRTGRLLRAIGDNRLAAELLGFDVNRNRAIAFIVAGAAAGIAGALASPLAGFRALGGPYYTINGFVALFLGGVATPLGALVGGLLIEALKILVIRYAGSGVQDYVVLVVALLIFRFRPQGLLAPTKARRA